MDSMQGEGELLPRIARELGKRVGFDLQPPTGERGRLILQVAREVAHAGERQHAPLAAYLLGRYAEMRRQGVGMAETDALAEAARDVGRILGVDDLGRR